MESPKLFPTAFQKQKANKVAAAVISTLFFFFFLKCLVCSPLQDLAVPDGVTVAAKVLLAGPGSIGRLRASSLPAAASLMKQSHGATSPCRL